MDRCYSPRILFLCVLLALLAGSFSVSYADQSPSVSGGLEFLTLINNDLAAGLITAEEALLYRFQYGFSPDQLPVRYRVAGFSPLRCATALIDEYYRERPRLSKETVDLIDTWLTPGAGKAQYQSPSGRFTLSFETTGTDAVPDEDLNPANGIPDYVERVAEYFDESWAVEVDDLGFATPPSASGSYAVSFESMQYYGYTTSVNAITGETRIVMHNTYIGFPDNEDPEGSAVGAAKVTAAHEFKHATQYAKTRWSEGGWVELDATWAEDVVFDQVNDYYNYLSGESPMRRPEIPLDGGANSTGSYEDCVWQIWMTETWGNTIIQDFWTRRSALSVEPVMETYRAILNARGVSLADGWAQFTAWNYGVGSRAIAGVGYEEGANYPEGPVADTAVMYPFNMAGSVEHLAADFVLLEGFSDSSNEMLHVVFDGQDSAGPLTLVIHVTRRDGTGLIEAIALDAANDADHLLSVPNRDVLTAGVIVGNAATSGLAAIWDLDLDLVPIPAIPAATMDRADVSSVLIVGAQGQEMVRLTNTGEVGSLLDYTAQLWTTHPDSGLGVAGKFGLGDRLVDKSVAGSTFTCATGYYLPGQMLNLNFTVYNGSADDEWLTDLSLGFPSGVSVLVSSDFVGGSLGDLESDNALGDGALVSWNGTYGVQDYGVVRNGESAYGTVQVLISPMYSGDLDISWTLAGDSYGGTPHHLANTMTLLEDSPVLEIQSPAAGDIYAVDDSFTVAWSTGGQVLAVDLDLSRDGGANWSPLFVGEPNDGNQRIALSGPPSNICQLRIRATEGGTEDISEGTFHLYESPDWVVGAPVVGSLMDTEFHDLTLDLDATDLATGTYAAWLVVLHSAPDSRTVLPLFLQVDADLSSALPPVFFELQAAYPNPFNPRTTISFSLPTTSAATVDVLNVRGHLVRRLFQGELIAGTHRQVWDGLDGSGRAVSAGVYLVRVRAGRHDGTVKILLAK